MKDTAFLHRLNGYLDGELAPEEVRSFEAEVAGDATKREMLRRYQLLQKGCAEVARRLAGPAPEAKPAVVGRVLWVPRPAAAASSSDGWWRAAFALGAAGAVAVAALMLQPASPVSDRPTETLATYVATPAPAQAIAGPSLTQLLAASAPRLAIAPSRLTAPVAPGSSLAGMEVPDLAAVAAEPSAFIQEMPDGSVWLLRSPSRRWDWRSREAARAGLEAPASMVSFSR